MPPAAPASRAALAERLRRVVLPFAFGQVRSTIERHPGFSPVHTHQGRWRPPGGVWTDWTGGFFAGLMWFAEEETGDPWWRAQAEAASRRLEHRKTDRNVHDLGFVFLSTYKPWLDRTGDPRLKAVMLEAAKTLSLRFQEKGRYLSSFMGPDSIFIDIMMNIDLLFWAAENGGPRRLGEVGRAHARTTERILVRPDGSTAHEGIFDLGSGAFLRQSTQQGWKPESCWSRGLAWSLYGFSRTYGRTRDPLYLEVAERNAACWLSRLPADRVSPWDFDVPQGPDRIKDSSASAIAACGLLDLADRVADPGRAARYRDAALETVEALASDAYLARAVPDHDGILLHGVYHKPKGWGVDEAVMWGDYFFVEACRRALAVLG